MKRRALRRALAFLAVLLALSAAANLFRTGFRDRVLRFLAPFPVVSAASVTPPPYTGEPVVTLGDGRPVFSKNDVGTCPFLRLGTLDALGRTTGSVACLGPETLSDEPRGDLTGVRPSGWHTVRYDDLIEDRYLFNRCHVIAHVLCGLEAEPRLLFTGTRQLNLAMRDYETQVSSYIRRTGNHVLYRGEPLYIGRELVARGILLEAWSVEDLGDGICFRLFFFNIQPGIRIDYASGESRREKP